jgi:hypothetical protein
MSMSMRFEALIAERKHHEGSEIRFLSGLLKHQKQRTERYSRAFVLLVFFFTPFSA